MNSKYFKNFDTLVENKNEIDLYKDGKHFVSLHGECSVEGLYFEKQNGNQFIVKLIKVYEMNINRNLPIGTELKLIFDDVDIIQIFAEGNSDFTTFEGLLIKSFSGNEEPIEIVLSLGPLQFNIQTSLITLEF